LCRSSVAESRTGGFTLIEALVALSIVAVTLSSIGALIAGSIKGTRSLEARLSRLGAAKAVLTALPERHELKAGSVVGDFAGNNWRIDVAPFVGKTDPKAVWLPQRVTMTVRNPGAGDIQIETVRLARGQGR
jgi:general secretion pathway protein I